MLNKDIACCDGYSAGGKHIADDKEEHFSQVDEVAIDICEVHLCEKEYCRVECKVHSAGRTCPE